MSAMNETAGTERARLASRLSESAGATRAVMLQGLMFPFAGLVISLGLLAAVSLYSTLAALSNGLIMPLQLTLILISGACLAVLGYRLREQLLVPFSDLRKWSQRIHAGNFATPVPMPENSEMAGVIRDINNLSHELNTLTEEMDIKVRAKTEHIASKSRSLEILYDIATDLSTARNLDELLEQFLDTLMVLVDACAATVRLLTDNGQTYMVASRGLSPEVIKQEQLVDVNRCLCGKIARDGGFGIQKGLEQCNQFLDCAMLQGECHELIVVPLQYRDKILGVYNLFLSRPSAELGKDVRDLLNSIGMHLGLAVEKARLDDNERRLAIMEERNMMGNELHDSLAQSLVSMRLQTKILGELLYKKNTRAAQNEVRRLRSAVEEAHVSLRELLANFKTGMDARGLIPSIEELVTRFKDETGITVFLQNEWNEYSFTPAQETQVYRIIQEALTNVRKHSNACTVRILLHNLDDDSFNVLIEDDGLGFVDRETDARPGENMGLNIMRERAGRLHGEVSIETEAGEGTRVCLAFPANPDEQQGKQRFGENRRAGTTH